jgi:hypothetical protein
MVRSLKKKKDQLHLALRVVHQDRVLRTEMSSAGAPETGKEKKSVPK